MLQTSDPKVLQEQCLAWRKAGLRVVLVPTMGYFHSGHESLMKKARELGDKVVVSLFVNPSQFGPTEDLSNYPRDLERDKALAEGNQVDALFTPTPADLYPEGYDTWVEVPGISALWCGKSRPTHFRGVCTIVLKLIMIAQPDKAIFGQKDWQQLTVIRRMVKDLNVPTLIEGSPTVREADGLAMSSRNSYLTKEERAQAPHLNKGLSLARQLFTAGETDSEKLKQRILAYWKENLPIGKLDYLELVNADTLQPQPKADAHTLAIVAMRVGKARLIDNLFMGE